MSARPQEPASLAAERHDDGCELCAIVAPDAPDAPAAGGAIALVRTASSVVLLAAGQPVHGATVVVARQHVRDAFELDSIVRQGFHDDIAATAAALDRRLRPRRLDYFSTGDLSAHLHCAIVPRADEPGHGEPMALLGSLLRAGGTVASSRTTELAEGLREDLAPLSADTTPPLRFDPLGVDDLPALQELCESCADYYHLMTGGPVPRSEAGTLFTIRPETAVLQDKFLVAVRQGKKLLGVLDLYRNYPRRKFAWLGLLLLHPDHRGQGCGASMITWVVDWAREQGCVRVRVGVADDNSRAIDVLRRHGFEETGERISRVSGARRLVLLPMEREIV